VVAAGALGRATELRAALRAAGAAGCTRSEIREALLVLSLFAGFPRTLDALAATADELGPGADSLPPPEERLPEGVEARRALFRARGESLFRRVYGDDAARVLERLFGLDRELPQWVLEDAYGKVLARPGLDAAERERLAVVLLAAQSLRNQLGGHVRGALRCGAAPEHIVASLEAASHLIPPADLELALDCVSRGLTA